MFVALSWKECTKYGWGNFGKPAKMRGPYHVPIEEAEIQCYYCWSENKKGDKMGKYLVTTCSPDGFNKKNLEEALFFYHQNNCGMRVLYTVEEIDMLNEIKQEKLHVKRDRNIKDCLVQMKFAIKQIEDYYTKSDEKVPLTVLFHFFQLKKEVKKMQRKLWRGK